MSSPYHRSSGLLFGLRFAPGREPAETADHQANKQTFCPVCFFWTASRRASKCDSTNFKLPATVLITSRLFLADSRIMLAKNSAKNCGKSRGFLSAGCPLIKPLFTVVCLSLLRFVNFNGARPILLPIRETYFISLTDRAGTQFALFPGKNFRKTFYENINRV